MTTFSLSITGKGVLVGPFITAAFDRWPDADLYDRTDQANAARGTEVGIAQRSRDRDTRRFGRKTRQSLKRPDKTTATINFTPKGSNQVDVEIKTNKKKKVSEQSYPVSYGIDETIRQILISIEHMI